LIINIGKDKTILLSTHIMQEVEAMCERVIIINNGNIVANDTITAIQSNATITDIHIITVEFAQEPHLEELSNEYISNRKQLTVRTFEFHTKHPQELRKQLMQWSMQTNNDILNIATNQASLESTFRSLT